MELIILIVLIVLGYKAFQKKKQKKLGLEQAKKEELVNKEDDRTIFMDVSGNGEEGHTMFMWDDTPKENRIILSDTRNDKTFSVKVTDALVIGASDELCDLQIDYDRTISRRHCMLIKRGNEYFIKDLNSTNGTFVNGSKVYLDERAIYHEDWIRLGKTEIQFLLK